MNSVAVIIPVYNLTGDRFNNFCFIIKQFCGLLHLCDVYVIEQTNESNKVQMFLQKYPEVKYYGVNQGTVFNKSKLINYGTQKSTSDYIWIVDGDFYTDYEYVLESIEEYAEFTRPYSKTILLNQVESEDLQELGYVVMNRDEYPTNSTDGKFSFIIDRDVFVKSKMMNEDFEGWGYQDLDFMENRLIKCSKTFIDVFGFHLYHKEASREHVNRNKRMFLNVSSTEQIPKEVSGIERIENEKPKEIPTPVNEQKEILSKPKVRVSKKVNKIIPKYDITHIHNKVREFNIFSAYKETLVIDNSTQYTTYRDISGRLKTKNKFPHFMLVYLNYIVENYEKLIGIYIFSTDFFYNTPNIFDQSDIRRISNILESKSVNFIGFHWLNNTSTLKLNGGHSRLVESKSKYGFNKWVELYIRKKPQSISKYALAGCFAVDSKKIKKNSLEYYTRILNQTSTWVEEDYLFLMTSLENIFA